MLFLLFSPCFKGKYKKTIPEIHSIIKFTISLLKEKRLKLVGLDCRTHTDDAVTC